VTPCSLVVCRCQRSGGNCLHWSFYYSSRDTFSLTVPRIARKPHRSFQLAQYTWVEACLIASPRLRLKVLFISLCSWHLLLFFLDFLLYFVLERCGVASFAAKRLLNWTPNSLSFSRTTLWQFSSFSVYRQFETHSFHMRGFTFLKDQLCFLKLPNMSPDPAFTFSSFHLTVVYFLRSVLLLWKRHPLFPAFELIKITRFKSCQEDI
jgi:hypothetical protein